MSLAYDSYEVVVNAVVGAVYMFVKSKRSDGRTLAMYGLEKAIINALSSLGSVYAATTRSDQQDTEYLLGAVLAGLYHSSNSFAAAGDQLVVSIISHLISNMSSTAGSNWFQRNVYGTAGTQPSNSTGGIS